MNITLKEKVFKIYDSVENTAEGTLTLRFLAEKYGIDAVKNYFGSATKDDLDEIVKTTDEGVHVVTYNHYTKVLVKAASKTISIEKDSTKIVKSQNENGEEIEVEVPTTVTEEIDVVEVILGYENPTDRLVKELDEKINPTIDVEECSLDELKAWQKKQVNVACKEAIEAGVDVELSDGKTYHFSYKAEDQINYVEMRQEIEHDGYTTVPYHPDNGDCTIYSSDDMKKIIKAQIANKFVLTTKCNAYHGMIKDAEDKAAVSAIVWGSNLSEKRQADFNKIVAAMQ
ncbi:hypothetical protein GPK90_04620 [Clostridium sp. MCC344]|nr:DUF3849 domain-containing protein [Clostridium sp. MCC344]MBT9788629.1 hypothetical protein [Clostridium sp. MCC344]